MDNWDYQIPQLLPVVLVTTIALSARWWYLQKLLFQTRIQGLLFFKNKMINDISDQKKRLKNHANLDVIKIVDPDPATTNRCKNGMIVSLSKIHHIKILDKNCRKKGI